MAKTAPRWFLIVAILFVLWNLMGAWSFFNEVTMSAEGYAAMPKAQQDLWNAMPKPIWLAFFVAIAAGLLGAIALLLRKAWAVPSYLVSLIAVVIQFGYIFTTMPVLSTIGPSAIAFPAFIIAMAALQFWFARRWRSAGWLA